MQLNYKQSQFELFPGAVNGSSKTHRPQFLFSSLTLSLENLVISSIVTLMLVIFAFSAGVEKGRKANFIKPSDNLPSVVSIAKNKQTAPKVITQAKSAALQNPATDRVVAENSATVTASVALLNTVSDAVNAQVFVQQQKDLSGTYTVQVASFKKGEFAEKEALVLKRKGYDIIVVPKGSYSIVCVGKFSRKEQANVILSQLKKTYKDCVLRRL